MHLVQMIDRYFCGCNLTYWVAEVPCLRRRRVYFGNKIECVDHARLVNVAALTNSRHRSYRLYGESNIMQEKMLSIDRNACTAKYYATSSSGPLLSSSITWRQGHWIDAQDVKPVNVATTNIINPCFRLKR